MKTALLALLLLPLASAPAAGAAETVTVTLQVNLGAADAPLLKECEVTVPEESNVGVVLDQAVLDECLLEWSAESFPGLGRYVASIDHVREAVLTFWAFRVNGAFSGSGIDSTFPETGDVLLFTYEEWPVPLP